MKKTKVIVAPHADDELIGCFSLIKDCKVILFGSPTALHEGQPVCTAFGIDAGLFRDTDLLDCSQYHFYIPDACYELHPLHRMIGHVGQSLYQRGAIVTFYSTNMNAPYIKEIPNPIEKREMLNAFYAEKSDLWKYDHRYFLFEGFNTWGDYEK